ncbi:stalk domain-containing protein [Paenibacillus sp. SI8]|uniref:stalk domain-containing protein n=1 Tax=unclassified Paenibacillus TaxID=185978 RepID=UPI00346519C1
MRKKKILATTLLFLCFSGIVSASSIHGDYNGDPIVNVLSQGKELKVEDVPATIRDGRTLVPLYLLKQAGASVKWDADTYTVDLTFPNPVEDFTSKLQLLKAKAADYDAKNIQLIYNEYGSYLKVDLEQSNDSNKDNDHIIALSSFVSTSPAELLVVNRIHNNKTIDFFIINKADAEEFAKKKLSEYEFMMKWRHEIVSATTDLSAPNMPPVAPTPTPKNNSLSTGTACREFMAAYTKQMQDAVISHNQSGSTDTKGLEQYENKLQERMSEALKENHCQQ